LRELRDAQIRRNPLPLLALCHIDRQNDWILAQFVTQAENVDWLRVSDKFDDEKNPQSVGWHVEAMGRYFELLTTGPKWFDIRANRGGGGAVDLTMHVMGINFKRAIVKLREILDNAS
jgi:hypothetical protein